MKGAGAQLAPVLYGHEIHETGMLLPDTGQKQRLALRPCGVQQRGRIQLIREGNIQGHAVRPAPEGGGQQALPGAAGHGGGLVGRQGATQGAHACPQHIFFFCRRSLGHTAFLVWQNVACFFPLQA